MEQIKKQRRRKHKISDEKLNSIAAEYHKMRRRELNKMDIYMKLSRVYGCGWQCIYNALQRAKKTNNFH